MEKARSQGGRADDNTWQQVRGFLGSSVLDEGQKWA